MFASYALQGLEAKKKGEYSREELASLAQTNVEALKEYAYFTFARADGKKQKFSELSTFSPVDYAAIAKATGAKGMRALTIDQVRAGLQQALAYDGPFLLDVLSSQRSDATVDYLSINSDGPSVGSLYSKG